MTSPGPTAPRRRLGTLLAELRKDAGLTQQDAAELLDCTDGKINHIERGRTGMKKAELAALVSRYNADDQLEDLEQLRREGAKRGWWATSGLPEWVRPFVGFENAASHVQNFELATIPGLLQTEAYATAIHRASRHTVPDGSIERLVNARVARQKRLTEETPPLELWAIISEVALRTPVGGPEVMADQLAHIAELVERPNVVVQVLPTDSGAHGCMSGPLVVLSFPDPADPAIGWMDTPLGGTLVDNASDVDTLRRLFDDLRQQAMGANESIAWLQQLITTDG